MMAAGMMLASISSLVLAMFLDRNNFGESLGVDELEQELGVPVLLTVPRVSTVRGMVS